MRVAHLLFILPAATLGEGRKYIGITLSIGWFVDTRFTENCCFSYTSLVWNLTHTLSKSRKYALSNNSIYLKIISNSIS